MCGLVGVRVLGGDFRVAQSYLAKMRDTMIHRGPDGEGLWIADDRFVGLAHRRLAIIDLSESANQPMSTADGFLHIVFNGEIYNHRALRAELDRLRRIEWRTDHSDTEVILEAYRTWGIDCLPKFRGMFAFALWDARTRDLWLCRDRFGIKPLYWSQHHGRVTFASEIKALLADPEQPRSLNEESLASYLSFMCVPAPETLFAGIRKLPAGSLLRIDGQGRLTEKRWYDLWEHVRPQRASTGDGLYEQVRDTLADSVLAHKAADVPLGIFLSGGVDSSTNALLFGRDSNTPVNTFSIGYEGAHSTYRNELDFARMIAKQVGSEHHERILNEDDLFEFLPRMIHLQDEPIADPVCMPIYYVSKLARDNGIKVCQVGEGADELFFGYPAWQTWLKLQNLQSIPGAQLAARLGSSALSLTGLKNNRAFDAMNRVVGTSPIFWSSALGLTRFESNSILNARLKRKLSALDGTEIIAPFWNRFRQTAWEPSALNWMTYIELNLRLPELLLMRVDKMGMGVSLEARVPFLDHEVVELACAIPEARKIGGGESKHVLKQSMRGLLPDEIIDRPKQGFGVPILEWLDTRLGAQISTQLTDFCRNTDIFDADGIRALFGGRSRVRSWYVYNFALWHRHFIEGVAEDRLLA